MAVNIKDGRRTIVAAPQWALRPDGLETAVVFQPGYNSDPSRDPSKNYGVHGMEISWYLRGPNGVAHFILATDWIPGKVYRGHGLPPPPFGGKSLKDLFPMGVDLGYHAPVPQWEDQGKYGKEDRCTLLQRGPCYYDGTALGAMGLAKQFTEHGEPVVWAALESRYADIITEETS